MIKRFGRWRVDDFGLTTYVGGSYKIVIAKDQLWIARPGATGSFWVSLVDVAISGPVNEDNVDDLIEAFYFAQEHFGNLGPSNVEDVSKAETEMLVRRYAGQRRG